MPFMTSKGLIFEVLKPSLSEKHKKEVTLNGVLPVTVWGGETSHDLLDLLQSCSAVFFVRHYNNQESFVPNNCKSGNLGLQFVEISV